MSKARQLEESTFSHTLATGGKTPLEQIDDFLLELELPATNTTRYKESTNLEHSSRLEPTPSRIHVSTRLTKRQATHRWILLANFSEDSKVANDPYEPTSFKEAIKDNMQKMWVDAMQEEFQFSAPKPYLDTHNSTNASQSPSREVDIQVKAWSKRGSHPL